MTREFRTAGQPWTAFTRRYPIFTAVLTNTRAGASKGVCCTTIAPKGVGKTYVACVIGIAACHSEHSVIFTRMDELARKLLIACENRRDHDALLERLRETYLLIVDDFLTNVGLDQNIASDVYGVLADREHKLPTIIVSETDPSYWVQVLPERVAGDSIVNRLANNTLWLLLGDADMRKLKHEKARESADFWE